MLEITFTEDEYYLIFNQAIVGNDKMTVPNFLNDLKPIYASVTEMPTIKMEEQRCGSFTNYEIDALINGLFKDKLFKTNLVNSQDQKLGYCLNLHVNEFFLGNLVNVWSKLTFEYDLITGTYQITLPVRPGKEGVNIIAKTLGFTVIYIVDGVNNMYGTIDNFGKLPEIIRELDQLLGPHKFTDVNPFIIYPVESIFLLDRDKIVKILRTGIN